MRRPGLERNRRFRSSRPSARARATRLTPIRELLACRGLSIPSSWWVRDSNSRVSNVAVLRTVAVAAGPTHLIFGYPSGRCAICTREGPTPARFRDGCISLLCQSSNGPHGRWPVRTLCLCGPPSQAANLLEEAEHALRRLALERRDAAVHVDAGGGPAPAQREATPLHSAARADPRALSRHRMRQHRRVKG